MKKQTAVYEICIDNLYYYVGSSVDVIDRLRRHKLKLIQGKHKNKKLQSMYNNSDKNINFTILHLYNNEDSDNNKHIIDESLFLDCYKNLYNNNVSNIRDVICKNEKKREYRLRKKSA